MPLKIKCPSCKHVLSVPVQRVGRTVRCPICETKLRVPKPRQTQGKKLAAKTDSTPDQRPKSTSEGKTRPSSEQRPQRGHSRERSPEAKKKRTPPNIPPPRNDVHAEPKAPTQPPAAKGSVDKEKSQGRPQSTSPKPPPLPKSWRNQNAVPEKPRADEPSKTLKADKDKNRQHEQKDGDTPPAHDHIAGKAEPQEQDNRESGKESRRSPGKPPQPPTLPPRRAAKDDPSASPPAPAGIDEQSESAPVNRRETPPTEPETQEEETSTVRGYEHDSRKRWAVYQFGIGLILAALFGAIPAVMDVVEHLRTVDSPGVSRWAYALLLLSGIQLAYAVYLIQLPDWSTVRVVSMVTLVLATVYAILLAVTTLATQDHQIIQFLELADKFGKKATGWSVILLGISSLLAYLSGRISLRWRQAYRLLTEPMATE